MQFHIAPGSELPIYRQIMHQVTDALAGGRLQAGDRLPSQRELAERLVVAPLTVKKAYDELERQGLIRTERGRGTFVAADTGAVDTADQRRRLKAVARELMSRAHLSGVSRSEVVRLIEEIDRELTDERRSAAAGQEEERS